MKRRIHFSKSLVIYSSEYALARHKYHILLNTNVKPSPRMSFRFPKKDSEKILEGIHDFISEFNASKTSLIYIKDATIRRCSVELSGSLFLTLEIRSRNLPIPIDFVPNDADILLILYCRECLNENPHETCSIRAISHCFVNKVKLFDRDGKPIIGIIILWKAKHRNSQSYISPEFACPHFYYAITTENQIPKIEKSRFYVFS